MIVIEFKHRGPFEGCLWRWEYLLKDKAYVYPVVFTETRLASPADVARYLLDGTVPEPIPEYYLRKHHSPKVWEWGEDLFREIPHNYVPQFYDVAESLNLPFTWWCYQCGEAITEYPPRGMAGYRGNGGVGIEVSGWLCPKCRRERCG
jgi:hypothetical protein